MISNAGCWTPPVAALLIAILWLSACATGGSDRLGQVCPPVVEYNRTTLNSAAIEIDDLPEDAVLTVMLSDYAVIREQARYCSETIK
ncbi:MAG: hypothetical protein Q8Q26_07570 [Pseudorhodobacter sp.]|nr:hypothetical protein [Pseudorhodobacter sp.]